jgi:hypothetical protein
MFKRMLRRAFHVPYNNYKTLSSYFLWVIFGKNKTPFLYGYCDGVFARKDLRNGNIQFILWKKGDQKEVDGVGHKKNVWVNFGAGRDKSFTLKERMSPEQKSIFFYLPPKRFKNNFDRVVNVIDRARRGYGTNKWLWLLNSRCKYITVRFDMADGHCVLFDRDGKEINIAQLEFQHKTKNKWS